MAGEIVQPDGVTVIVRNGARRVTIIFEPDNTHSISSMESVTADIADFATASVLKAAVPDEIELELSYKIGGTAQVFFMNFTSPYRRVQFEHGKAKVRLPKADTYPYDWTLYSTPGKASVDLTVKLGDTELSPKLKEDITDPVDGQGDGYFRHPVA